MESPPGSSERGQDTVEWIGVLVVVVLILGVVVNSEIEQRVADGLRCQISRIFGSSAGCATGHSGVGGGAINAGVTRGGVTRGGPASGEAIRGGVTRGGVISARRDDP